MTTREYTNKIIRLVDEGEIDPKLLLEKLLTWCSEHDIEKFYDVYLSEFFEENEDDQDIRYESDIC